MIFLALGVAAYVVLIWRIAGDLRAQVRARPLMGAVLIFFMKGPEQVVLDPKVWGVVLMGVATLIFFLLPWLDQSPVKSIRYKGSAHQDRAGALRDRVPRPGLPRHAAR